MNNDRPILVFDSGFGGLSVLKQLVKQLPGERYLYFGDSANAPYGPRQPEEIAEIVRFLVTKKGQATIDQFYIRRYSGLAFD